jgi:predicted permease
MPPALVAVGTLVVGFIAAVILFSTDHTLIGVVVALAAVPCALVAWVMAGDRV